MEKSNRPVRNRRHSRRAWPPSDIHHRPVKRLFTPEIKRMLKDWLIRRRDNPYPSRDEKKSLAIETGLTYTQICNWFANWRRKLKNSEREKRKKSWGHLIKNYNTNAKGNVEQFSISSADSIWEEEGCGVKAVGCYDDYVDFDDEKSGNNSNDGGENMKLSLMKPHTGSYQKYAPNFYIENMQMEKYNPRDECATTIAQCYQISSTTSDDHQLVTISGSAGDEVCQQHHLLKNPCNPQPFMPNTTKYKQQIMEKYLRDTSAPPLSPSSSTELSKWLESAAKFTPNKNNYFIELNSKGNKLEQKQRPRQSKAPAGIESGEQHIYDTIHQKEEIDAAEALANLAFNCRQKMLFGSGFALCGAANN